MQIFLKLSQKGYCPFNINSLNNFTKVHSNKFIINNAGLRSIWESMKNLRKYNWCYSFSAYNKKTAYQKKLSRFIL